MVDWVRDELILVTDAVRINGWRGVRASSLTALDLSALLAAGQLHSATSFPTKFRSPSSIQRKSYDIATRHPEYTGKLTRGGPLEAGILNEFFDDAVEMHAVALGIRAALKDGESMSGQDQGADEGGILLARHLRRERNPALRSEKLREHYKTFGKLTCEACGFDFRATYGARGAGYIEVHHRQPLHTTGPRRTYLKDLALLCANCHRMCHKNPWVQPEELLSHKRPTRRPRRIA